MKEKKYIRRLDNETDSGRFYQEVVEKEDGIEEILWSYASVTHKLDKVYPTDYYLVKWIRDQGIGGQAIFEKAADEGTEVHVAIERLWEGEQVPTIGMSDKVKRCVQAFVDWHNEFKPKKLACEKIVVNHEYKYAGTLDLLCELNYERGKTCYKGIYIVDYKTSTSIYDKHKVQQGAYWKTQDPATKTALLHLGNRTKAGWSFLEFEPQPYWEQFKHFNETFNLLYPEAKPSETIYPDLFKLNQK